MQHFILHKRHLTTRTGNTKLVNYALTNQTRLKKQTLLIQPYSQQGFTLVELMISLVLGLLISAAAVQIYLTNARTSTVQKSGSELQDASVFGIQLLESHIRLANLGNPLTNITDTTTNGGIVLSGNNIGIAAYPNTGYLTHSTGDTGTSGANGWTGLSNTASGKDSDQLTIQFTNTTPAIISDCEGADIAVGATAIERYFIRTSTNSTTGLVLACDAGRVAAGTVSNFGDAGQEFITNVDQFKVLLGTQTFAVAATSTTAATTAGQSAYMPSAAYMALATKPAITAVKIGLIVHGSTPVIGSTGQTSFTLLGQPYTMSTAAGSNLVRTTYESTTLLRNARVSTS